LGDANCIAFQFLAATKRQETATPRLPYLNISRREPNSPSVFEIGELFVPDNPALVAPFRLSGEAFPMELLFSELSAPSSALTVF